TITYYDDYDFTEAPSSFPQQIGDGNDPIEVHYDNSNKKPKGLTTGVWERVTSESTVVVREMTYMFYDVKSNPVRTFTTNHTNGRTQTDSKVDFAGKVNYTITNHKKFSSDQDLEIKETFTYSNQ